MDSPVECGAGWGLVGNLTPVLELPRFEPRGSNLPDIENSFLASPFPPLPGVMLSPMSRHYCPSAGARMGIQVWVCLGPKQVQILAGTLPEIAIRMINMGFFNIMDLPLVSSGFQPQSRDARFGRPFSLPAIPWGGGRNRAGLTGVCRIMRFSGELYILQ